MYLISIDGSTTATGIAIFEIEDGIQTYVSHTLIKGKRPTARKGSQTKKEYKEQQHFQMEERVESMILHLYSYFQHYHPDIIIMEDTFMQHNPYSVKMLARLQGAVLGYGLQNRAEVIFKTPSLWRSEVGIKTKNGNTTYKREQLKKFAVQLVSNVYDVSATDDEAEAICIGLSYDEEFKEYIKRVC